MANGKKKGIYSERLFTPIGRVSYPHVFERPPTGEDGKERKYEISLLIPKKSDISELLAAVEKVGKEAFGAKWKGHDRQTYPTVKDGDEKDDPRYHGHWVVKAKTDRRPGVVDRNGKAIEEKEDLYGGCWARASLKFGSYETLGNWGVTAYLNNVQKVRDDEPFGGDSVRAEDEFGAFADEAASVSDNF